MESNLTPNQRKRQKEREIIDEYHKLVTEEALEPLYQSFLEWKSGALPYFELTELIHLFHKKNQGIYKDFEYTGGNRLILLAKMKLGRLTEKDIIENERLLELLGYEDKPGSSPLSAETSVRPT
ncbi:hypothetical protein [Paenibacillus eucommiae]|uniref:Uncharacterized protein n=1 Tax=Paenibacillus eucommiae TaxID=1355755 RepID=A0ABS4J6Q7_9BACL|nr:hypothetical protein [Paenibacillus eucommiae]MBP1995473.1 hypothetical protein [Paenibacillus eucommiae]